MLPRPVNALSSGVRDGLDRCIKETSLCVCMNVCIYIYTCMYCMYVRIYVCKYVCMYVSN